MLPIVFLVLVSFVASIHGQGAAPPELLSILPASYGDKVTQAYNSLPPDQQSQATQAAQALTPQQRQNAQTLFADPAVQSGNVNGASPAAKTAGQSFCGSSTPDQQSFVFGLANAVGVNAPSSTCSTLGGGGGSPSPTPAPAPVPSPTSTFAPSPQSTSTFAPAPTPSPTSGPGPVGSTPGPAPAGQTPVGQTPVPTPGGPDNDIHERCCLWAQMGECDRNPFWMKPNCRKSCGTPGATVENALSKPSKPSTNCNSGGTGPNVGPGNTGPGNTGSGNTGPGMSGSGNTGPGMPGSGNTGPGNTGSGGPVPPGCVDSNQLCAFWASQGQCNSNPFWMRPNCPRSCNSCGATIGNALQFGGAGAGGI